MANVNIKFNGKEFLLSCENGQEEHLEDLSLHLNEKFNNLKISNLINDLNDFRYDYFKVPQINETHVLNYFFSELKNSIKI